MPGPGQPTKKAGIEPIGRMTYELADGTIAEYPFGLVVIEFMGEITSGRVIFGPKNVEPLLGVTALESVGILVDPSTQKLQRLPAIPLKSIGIRNPQSAIRNLWGLGGPGDSPTIS